MSPARVDLDAIECESAFDIGRHVMEASGPPEIRFVELDDILYLPHVLEAGQSLCLFDHHVVPAESVLDCFAVQFFKKTRHRHPDPQRRFAEPFVVRSASGLVCILGNLFSRNFGHWTEELLKVAILEQSAYRGSYVIPTLPPFAEDSLRVLGIDKSRVLVTDEPTLFARAVFTTAVSHENIAGYPVVLDQLRQLVESRMGQDSSRYGPRLWLERRASLRDGGVVVNRDEVYRCLEPYRFDIVDLATLSFAEQLSTVRHATVIAGPHGSQFVHAQFMPPGSTILECFSPAYVNPSILQICRVLRHRYHQVVGRCNLVAPYTHGRDCEVDCEHLALVLDSLELGAGAARNAGQTS